MDMISLRGSNEAKTFDQLFAVSRKISSVLVVSAYSDIASIEAVVNFTKNNRLAGKKPSLRFFVDSSSSHFFSDKHMEHEFLQLNKRIRSFCDGSSGIYLVQFGALFHSKAYLIEGRNTGKVFFGSLNLTRRGIESNEELVIWDDYNIGSNSYANRLAASLKQYADGLHEKSMRVDEKDVPSRRGSISSMRELLLNGVIWYELKEQNPFRFALKLPDDVVNQTAEIDPLLDASVQGSIAVDKLMTYDAPSGLGLKLPKLTDKAQWKKYCIETCYGHWNPVCLRKELDEELGKRKRSREPYYDKIYECLRGNRQQLTDCFLRLQDRIQQFLVQKGVSGWKYADAQDAEDAWIAWFDRILSKVENKDYYNRLKLGIASVPAPDVWGDPLSATEFEESFCNSLIYLWSKEVAKGTRNRIAQATKVNLGLVNDIKEELDVEKLQTLIEAWLAHNKTKRKSMVCGN